MQLNPNAGCGGTCNTHDDKAPCRAQTELAAERELRIRTEAEAAQAAQRGERKVGELSKALADAAADVQAARHELLQSGGRAEARQVPLCDACGAPPVRGMRFKKDL